MQPLIKLQKNSTSMMQKIASLNTELLKSNTSNTKRQNVTDENL